MRRLVVLLLGLLLVTSVSASVGEVFSASIQGDKIFHCQTYDRQDIFPVSDFYKRQVSVLYTGDQKVQQNRNELHIDGRGRATVFAGSTCSGRSIEERSFTVSHDVERATIEFSLTMQGVVRFMAEEDTRTFEYEAKLLAPPYTKYEDSLTLSRAYQPEKITVRPRQTVHYRPQYRPPVRSYYVYYHPEHQYYPVVHSMQPRGYIRPGYGFIY